MIKDYKLYKPLILGGLMLFMACSAQPSNETTRFNIVENQADKRVDITVDG